MMNYDETLRTEIVEDEIEADLQVNISRFGQAVIWGTDWTTETIALQLDKGNIDLNPSFQRRDAWTDREKSRLIESLMLGLPVPPIILAENPKKKNSYIVIDGKQRLLSIRRFYSKITEKEFREQNLQEKNVFKQLKLSGLEVLKDLNGCSYLELEKANSEYITNMENQSIRTIVIKNWPDEAFLYTVFLRLNTGSKQLSPQELRQALKPGEFLKYLDDATANSSIIKDMLNNKEPDPRMKDIELALRYFAYLHNISNYSGNLKSFLDEACDKLNKSWDTMESEITNQFNELENAIKFSKELFSGQSPFSRYTDGVCNNRFNRSIFELFSYYFSRAEIRLLVESQKDDFKEQFIALNDDRDFSEAVNDTTKDINRVVKRFSMFTNLLKELSDKNEMKTSIQHFSLVGGRIVLKLSNSAEV